jgi:simple sugar transport system permease protein
MAEELIVGILAAALRLATPILFASVGETVAQRSGVINVGLEGIMLMGAFTAVAGAVWTGSPWLGLVLAIIVGVAMAAIHAFVCLRLLADQIVAGIALATFGLGLSGFSYRLTIGSHAAVPIPSFSAVDFGPLSTIPVIGPVFFQSQALVYIAFASALAVAWFISRTGWGLAIRAVGEYPMAAHAAGINVTATRTACVLFGGAMAAMGGAYLSIAQLGNFVEDMVAGRGFIAIACVVYGRWNPLGVLAACLFFGLIDAAQIRLQSLITVVPYQFFVILPYALAIGALALFSRRSQMPGALARPFVPGS